MHEFHLKNTSRTEGYSFEKVYEKINSSILDKTLKKINFISIEDIKKCYILDSKSKDRGLNQYSLQLEGINFFEIFKYEEFIDINKITTNDIGTVLRIYGVYLK